MKNKSRIQKLPYDYMMQKLKCSPIKKVYLQIIQYIYSTKPVNTPPGYAYGIVGKDEVIVNVE